MLLDGNLSRQARSHRLAFLFTIIAGFLCGGFVILQAKFTAELINAVFINHIPVNLLYSPIQFLIIVLVLRAASQFCTDFLSARIGIVIKEQIRLAIIQKINRLGPVYTSGEKSGELSTLLTDGIEALDPYFSQYIPQLILAAFIPVIIVVSIFPTDKISFVILLITAPLLPVFMYLLGSLAERSTQKQWMQLLRLGSYFYDTIQGLQLLKSINQSQTRGLEIQKNNSEYQHLTMNVLRLTFLSAFVLEFIATISTAIIAVEIGLRLLSGSLNFAAALYILLLTPEFYLPLRQLGVKFHAGMSGRTASLKIFSILSEKDIASDPISVKKPIVVPSKNSFNADKISEYFPISFLNMGAIYPETNDYVLKDITFTINRYEKIALVGKSGVGKTSLSYVFMRLFTHCEGSVLFGDKPIQDIPAKEFNRLISWVPQSPYLFSGSILENICLFQADPDRSRIMAAIEKAQMDSYIHQLPLGYDTQVGERGSLVSTGQAQRLAIARAFYRDTPILVMDEPTSSVDPETESALIESLSELKTKKTVFMIAHRLSTITSSDQILVMEEGRIKEKGNHAELMSHGKDYYQLFNGEAGEKL
jgi:ATP-binding cassette subfamily C protein CydD